MILQESSWSGAETAPKPLTLRRILIRTTEFCKNPWRSFSRTIRRRPASKRRLKVKSQWIIGFLLACALAISANAQANSSVQTAEGPIANLARQNSGGATSPATQLQAPAGLQDAGTYPGRLPLLAYAYDPGVDAGANRSRAVAPRQSAPAQTEAPAQGGGMSPTFSAAALHALSTLRSMRTDLAYTLDNGYPLEKLWLADDRNRAADALDLAALAAFTEADHATMRELLEYFGALQRWSDGLLVANREMRLAQHYMTPGALQNDGQYQALLKDEESLSALLGSIRSPGGLDPAEESSSAYAGDNQ